MKKRLEYLDSARGIAALMVVIYHCIHGYGDHKMMGTKEAHIVSSFINGADAVSFFFVLSGFVLSYRYFKDNSIPNYAQYIIARLFRLYPAFLFMLFGSILFINRHDYSNLPYSDYLKEATLLQNFSPILGQTWSLNIELACSLLLPIFILVAQREIRYMFTLLPIVLVLHFFISEFHFNFILGIIVGYWYAHKSPVLHDIYQWSKKNLWITIPVLFTTFSLRHLWRLAFPTPLEGYDWFKSYTGIDFFTISALASFIILIILLESQKLQNILHKKIFTFLGKISYSLYICHWFFLYIFVGSYHDRIKNKLLIDDISTMVIVSVVTLIMSLTLATVMYYLIEKPFIQWGKKIANRFTTEQ